MGKIKTGWATRTIRNGRAKILGRWFIPDSRYMKYDGRLDGKRFLFGLYWNSLGKNFMCGLWGTEELSKAVNDDDKYNRLCELEPQYIDNGDVWYWWYPETPLETDVHV